MMAGAQVMLTHGMADGKVGLSVDDVVLQFHMGEIIVDFYALYFPHC
jgi:hypothetical protein